MALDTEEAQSSGNNDKGFLAELAKQIPRGFVEATLYATVGAAVLSQTQSDNYGDYSVAEAALDGAIGGVLLAVPMAVVSKGVSMLKDRLYQSRPCTSAPDLLTSMSNYGAQAKVAGKWLMQSAVYASSIGIGNIITHSSASSRAAVVVGEVGFGVVAAAAVGVIGMVASASAVMNYVDNRTNEAMSPLGSSASLDSELSRQEGLEQYPTLFYNQESSESLGEKNQAIMMKPY